MIKPSIHDNKYHYAKLLGLGLKRSKYYQKRKRISVRAEKPNEMPRHSPTQKKI